MEKLTVEDIREIARQHYTSGGDVVYECWENCQIQEWLDRGNGKKQLSQLFEKRQEELADAAYYKAEGVGSVGHVEEEIGEEDWDIPFVDDPYYASSATAGDYLPVVPGRLQGCPYTISSEGLS